MRIIGGPQAPMSDAQRGKYSILKALLIALIASVAFAMFFPALLFAIFIAMIPGISDVAWWILQFPVKLFNLPVPESDSAGYTGVMAGRIYGVLVFLIVFFIKVRQRHKQGNSAEEPNDA